MSEREILFRGKRVDNGEWIEGYFLPGNERKSLHPCIFVYLPETQSFECFDIDIDTLGEYTGLTDKNGTRIFEGDIVKTSHGGSTYYAKIEWDDGSFWVTNHDIQMPSYISEVSKTYLEVIGNIHDNPELLKGD